MLNLDKFYQKRMTRIFTFSSTAKTSFKMGHVSNHVNLIYALDRATDQLRLNGIFIAKSKHLTGETCEQGEPIIFGQLLFIFTQAPYANNIKSKLPFSLLPSTCSCR